MGRVCLFGLFWGVCGIGVVGAGVLVLGLGWGAEEGSFRVVSRVVSVSVSGSVSVSVYAYAYM